MWFKKNKKIDEKTGEELLPCPRDGKLMNKIIKNEVVLDVCPKCGGLWVDEGELEKLESISSKKETSPKKSIKKAIKKTNTKKAKK